MLVALQFKKMSWNKLKKDNSHFSMATHTPNDQNTANLMVGRCMSFGGFEGLFSGAILIFWEGNPRLHLLPDPLWPRSVVLDTHRPWKAHHLGAQTNTHGRNAEMVCLDAVLVQENPSKSAKTPGGKLTILFPKLWSTTFNAAFKTDPIQKTPFFSGSFGKRQTNPITPHWWPSMKRNK